MDSENRPLEMKDILSMNGEPVWLEYPNSYRYPDEWALVNVFSNKFCMAYFVNKFGNEILCSQFFEDGGKAYNSKKVEGRTS